MKCLQPILIFVLALCFISNAPANTSTNTSIYLGSREGDPDSIVDGVSVIHGDYSEREIDLVVPAPDPLVLSRYYSSIDVPGVAAFGGWRFFPQCYLTVQEDLSGKSYSTSEGMFTRTYALVGSAEGSVLTYSGWVIKTSSKTCIFKIDAEVDALGLSNNARGQIRAWTNLKNDELHFNPKNNTFELRLCSGGKRFYTKHAFIEPHLLDYEILPSGNKVFYEYDSQGRLTLIKATNSSEATILGWIQIQYGTEVQVMTSNGKALSYLFEQTSSGSVVLTQVIRPTQPSITYQYQFNDKHPLLVKKDLSEGRLFEISYENTAGNRVKEVVAPEGRRKQFVYEQMKEGGRTTVYDASLHKTVYCYDRRSQLSSVGQYLGDSLYRTNKKIWGKKKDVSNLIGSWIEDGSSNVFYYLTYSYDEKGNILQEREYGNLTGANTAPIVFNEEGVPEEGQESHVKTFTYTYPTEKNKDIVFQTDEKGSGIKFTYKRGTNLLIGKAIYEKTTKRKRYYYKYDANASVIRITVDDGQYGNSEKISYVHERYITSIVPKSDLPNIGTPEGIEEKIYERGAAKELLQKKIVNHFDEKGRIISEDFYDANDQLKYTIEKNYDEQDRLVRETDPLGNECIYTYDAYHNLISEYHSANRITYGYDYDLAHRVTCERTIGANQQTFEIKRTYDLQGNLLSVTDRYGNLTLYEYDDLGRILKVSYPEILDENGSRIQPIYKYTYDVANGVTFITDPRGFITEQSNNVRGQPVAIHHPDGTEELFKYDPEGSLHRHRDKKGLVSIYEYDFEGRPDHIETYTRNSKGAGSFLSSVRKNYNAFHVTQEKDKHGNETVYEYHQGRLSLMNKKGRKVEFTYDSMGRPQIVKKWATTEAYTLDVREYDDLGRVIEERTEAAAGQIFRKKRHVYDAAGNLAQTLGYPSNQETVLVHYEYDSFSRVSQIKDAYQNITQIFYHDDYANELGQKVLKTNWIDPLGSSTEQIFDAYQRITKITKKSKEGKSLSEVEFFYDAVGNKIAEKHAVISEGQLLKTHLTKWSYGPSNHLESTTRAAESDNEQIATFSYDTFGDLIKKTNSFDKSEIGYEYNFQGNFASIYCPGNNKPQLPLNYKLNYSSSGDFYGTTQDDKHYVTYKFDAHDQMLSESVHDPLGQYEINLDYDAAGRIVSIKLPDASFIYYTYEGPVVKSVTRLDKYKNELYVHQMVVHDQMGNLVEEILPGHVGQRKQQFNLSGRRTGVFTDFFQEQIPKDGFDVLGNIKKREFVCNGENYSSTYTYNELSQLVSEGGGGNHSYAYDSLDNRLRKGKAVYKVNDFNQLLEDGEASYDYDSNGNLLSKTIQGKTTNFQCNALNQLLVVKDPDQNTVSFNYDLNKRLSKTVEVKGKKAKTYRYFYLGNMELGCLDEKGNILELKVPADPNAPETSTCIAFELKDEIYTPLYDLQGNVVCLIDPKKREVIERYTYSAFGEEEILDESGDRIAESSIGNPWRYQGKRKDKETGLIFFGYRYYDPSTGRWTNPDPAGIIDGPNLYAFVHSNPFKYVDYFGLASEVNQQDKEFKTYFYGMYEPHCYCKRHRECKRGGDIGKATNALGGSALGGISFGFSYMRGLVQNFGTMAMEDFISDMELDRGAILAVVENDLAEMEEQARDWVTEAIAFDPTSELAMGAALWTYRGAQVLNFLSGNFRNGPKGFCLQKPSSANLIGYTKSNLRLGQQVHKSYKAAVADKINLRKEFVLPSGRRIDFIDITNGKVYELKPNNPRAIREGMKQLEQYVKELKEHLRLKHIECEGILEVY